MSRVSQRSKAPPTKLDEPLHKEHLEKLKERTFKPKLDLAIKSGGIRPFKPGEKDYDENPPRGSTFRG